MGIQFGDTPAAQKMSPKCRREEARHFQGLHKNFRGVASVSDAKTSLLDSDFMQFDTSIIL